MQSAWARRADLPVAFFGISPPEQWQQGAVGADLTIKEKTYVISVTELPARGKRCY